LLIYVGSSTISLVKKESLLITLALAGAPIKHSLVN
jgi:hypothetical protein